MSETTTASHAELVDQRTKAFVAVALGLLGALGGGIIAHAVQAVALLADFSRLAGPGYMFVVLVQGLASAVLGGIAIVLGRAAGARPDAVATPVGRAAVVLGAIAVVGGAVTMLVGLVEGV